jgi:hypothetical protein
VFPTSGNVRLRHRNQKENGQLESISPETLNDRPGPLLSSILSPPKRLISSDEDSFHRAAFDRGTVVEKTGSR